MLLRIRKGAGGVGYKLKTYVHPDVVDFDEAAAQDCLERNLAEPLEVVEAIPAVVEEGQKDQAEDPFADLFAALPELTPDQAKALVHGGYIDATDLIEADPAHIGKVLKISKAQAKKLLDGLEL